MADGGDSGHERQAPEGRWRMSAGGTPGPAPVPAPARRLSPTARFFGGNPAAVLLRLVVLSIVVGVVFAVFGFDPRDLVLALGDLVRAAIENSTDLVQAIVRYFLLGAAIVFPVWLVLRLVGMATRR